MPRPTDHSDPREREVPSERAASRHRTFLVQIDLAALRAHLSREDNVAISEEEVRQWLMDAGFTPTATGWSVCESDLGQLRPEEISSADVLDDE